MELVLLGAIVYVCLAILLIACLVAYYQGVNLLALIVHTYCHDFTDESLPFHDIKPSYENGRMLQKKSVMRFTDFLTQLRFAETSKTIDLLLKKVRLNELIISPTKASHFAAVMTPFLKLYPTFDVYILANIIVAISGYLHSSAVVLNCIEACFMSTRGSHCSDLKMAVDQYISIFNLIHVEMKKLEAKQNLLDHFEREKHHINSHNSPPRIQLISDIDDTMYCALFDKRYPAMTIYPGLREFYSKICVPRNNVRYLQRIVFLTARPEFLRSKSEMFLKTSGVTHFTLLMGSLGHLIGAKRMASRKLKNYLKHREIFPEFQFIFIGDNGQGDIDLAKVLKGNDAVLSTKYNSSSTATPHHDSAIVGAETDILTTSKPLPPICLIHDIIRDHKYSSNSIYRKKECDMHDIFVFQSYIGAAYYLSTIGIFSPKSVYAVIESTFLDFSGIQFHSKQCKERCSREIQRDVYMSMSLFSIERRMRLIYQLNEYFPWIADKQESLIV